MPFYRARRMDPHIISKRSEQLIVGNQRRWLRGIII